MSEQTWLPPDYGVTSSSNTPSLGSSSASRKSGNVLDKDAFLNLLVTQMRYQDPLNPMDDKETIAQLAQFSALEQMQNLNKSSSQTQAYALLGKVIKVDMYNESSQQYERIIGVVESVSMINGETYVIVDGKQIKVSQVEDVYPNDVTLEQLAIINSNVASLQSIGLIGKNVQAITFDDENNANGFVEGSVSYMKVSGYDVILVVNNKDVYLSDVVAVSDDSLLLNKTISASVQNDEDEIDEFSGVVSDVKIIDQKRYLVIDGRNVEIENIAHVTEALSLVDKSISAGGISGVVNSVVIKDGKPVLRVGDENEELDFSVYKEL